MRTGEEGAGRMRKKMIGRRDFMKSTLAGFGGLFFLPPNQSKAEVKVVETKGKEKTFVYRTLGKTGIKLPVINMGVMNTNNPTLVRVALDSGIVMLDTAQTYQRGQNEGMIGEVLKGTSQGFLCSGDESAPPVRSKNRSFYGRSNGRRFSKKSGSQP